MTARDVVLPHFPDLSTDQLDQLDAVARTVWDWNQRINVISRKDPLVMERHVLHSLGIAKVLRFEPGSRILDVGTGGGFPGLPLAVLHPDCEFVIVRQHREENQSGARCGRRCWPHQRHRHPWPSG